MPNYKKHGKILTPLTDEEFDKGIRTGKFVKWRHKALVVLLYYTGIRCSESVRALKEQFKITKTHILFDVGPRLKTEVTTAPLPLPLDAPHMDLLKKAVHHTRHGHRVFPYCSKTVYNIVARVFHYPHHLRLSRITNFLQDGFTVTQVRSWTGHKSLVAIQSYIGLVNIRELGDSLRKQQKD